MIVQESIIRDMARLFVWNVLRRGISVVPVKQVFPIYATLGKIHFFASPVKRRLVIENLKHLSSVTGQPIDYRCIARKFFETYYISQLLIFLFPRLSADRLQGLHRFEGKDRLERDLKRKSGCILLHAHFGPVHLPLFHFGSTGYPIKQIGFRRGSEELSRIGKNVSLRLRKRYEETIPAEIIQANRFLRKAFTHLQNGGIVMMPGDGIGRGEFLGRYEPFSFLGQRMLFPIGPAKLAQKTGAGILPMFTIKGRKKFQYTTVIGKPIYDGKKSGKSEYLEITEKFISIFEYYVKMQPYHWHFWDEFVQGGLIV